MKYRIDGEAPRLAGDCYIAPSAQVIGRVHLGHDASIWFNAVVRGDEDEIHIGDGTNIQDGSVLHVDAGVPLRIGRRCTIGHMVMLHGCSIGDGCLIGIGSTVLNKAEIGAGSIVGAHSLVTEGKRFPPGSLILGSPAKFVRELTEEERAQLDHGADHYIENGRRYARGLQPDPDA